MHFTYNAGFTYNALYVAKARLLLGVAAAVGRSLSASRGRGLGRRRGNRPLAVVVGLLHLGLLGRGLLRLLLGGLLRRHCCLETTSGVTFRRNACDG